MRTGLPGSVRPGLLVGGIVVIALLVIYPLVLDTSFWLNTGVLALLFATAGAGWNVLGGYTGQISFGNATFFGIGAYTTALLVRAGWSPWPTFVVGAVVAGAVGFLIGLPCFRLRSHYFAIATIAVGEIAYVVVNSAKDLGATAGLTIPLAPQGLASLQFSVRNPTPYYYVALVLFALATLAVWVLVRGRTGMYLQSIRDDEQAAAACGVPVWRYKLVAVTISGAMTAVPGGVYAMYVLFVEPMLNFDLSVSINIVLIAVLGGAGRLLGPLWGAWALIVLQEYTRQRFGGTNAGLDLLIFGGLIVLIVVVEPGGLTRMAERLVQALHRRTPSPGEETP